MGQGLLGNVVLGFSSGMQRGLEKGVVMTPAENRVQRRQCFCLSGEDITFEGGSEGLWEFVAPTCISKALRRFYSFMWCCTRPRI